MKSVKVEFKIVDDGDKFPSGYQYIKFHMIFEIKMEDFRINDRLSAEFHIEDDTPTITHASVVSRKTVKISLRISA